MASIHSINQQPFKLVLASQSPRRAQLLTNASYQFTVVCPPDAVEEEANENLPCERLVLNLAYAKGRYVADRLVAEQGQRDLLNSESNQVNTIVIAADTVAECENAIMGKPADREHAAAMLRLMSGKQHRVLTGVSLWSLNPRRHIERLEITTLVMDSLDEKQLEIYLSSEDWRGKAGAFGYQDGLDWVHIVDGLASNVVGLPVERLPEWIDQLNSEQT